MERAAEVFGGAVAPEAPPMDLKALHVKSMRIQALYRKPHTSKQYPTHAVFPYAQRGLAIERANQVWALDISAP